MMVKVAAVAKCMVMGCKDSAFTGGSWPSEATEAFAEEFVVRYEYLMADRGGVKDTCKQNYLEIG